MGDLTSRATIHQTLITTLLISVVFVLVLGVRLTWLSSSHVKQAYAAFDQENITQGLDSLNRAVRNYFPGNPYSKQAVEVALYIIDTDSQNVNEDLHQLRGSILSVRSFYQPYSGPLETIEQKLKDNP